MNVGLPGYVPIIFILTTFVTLGFILHAVRRTGNEGLPAQAFAFLIPFWLFFTAILAIYGFYSDTSRFPPRVIAAGALPAIIVSLVYLAFFRRTFVDELPLRVLTLLHIVRIPVELVLFWLYGAALVPKAMTFEGWNFDIVSGLTAPVIAWLAFRGGRINRPLLIAWNVIALILLFVIVGTAAAAFPSPMQQIAFDQPNRAVVDFPFIWLPAIIVPVVLFAHLASLSQLSRRPT